MLDAVARNAPSADTVNEVMIGRTLVARHAIAAVELAMELAGALVVPHNGTGTPPPGHPRRSFSPSPVRTTGALCRRDGAGLANLARVLTHCSAAKAGDVDFAKALAPGERLWGVTVNAIRHVALIVGD